MRIGFGMIAGSLVLTWAAASTLSAGPNQGKTVSPPAAPEVRVTPSSGAVSELRVRPSNGLQQSTPVGGISALTAGECEVLGGSVKDDATGVCASGKKCHT